MRLPHFLLPTLGFSLCASAFALAPLPVKPDLVVAKDGSGDFTSVQAAMQSIPKGNHERKIVLIKDGVYNERVRIDASCVTLRGESRTGTRIEAGAAQPATAQSGEAQGGAGGRGGGGGPGTVLTINGDDVVLENLTIRNTHGVLGVHAFAVSGRGDRTVIQDADMLSHGNDTIALWRTSNGQFSEDAANHTSANGRYYHTRLKVTGSVDFVCPRGWCYMSDSELVEMNPTSEAAMWHDGSRDQDMKFVMVRCRFDGPPEGFRLARHHHDGMFFFIDATFSKNMQDKPPYRQFYPIGGGPASDGDKKKNKDADPSNIWGERAYFFNSHREGGDYAFHRDTLFLAPGGPKPEQITAKWTFAGTWDPERTDGPRVESVAPAAAGKFVVTFSEPVTAKGKVRVALGNGAFAELSGGNGSNKLEFTGASASGAKPKLDLNGGAIIACEAGATVRVADVKMP